MSNDKQFLDELPEVLGEIVAGLVSDPVPTELKSRVRSRLTSRLTSRFTAQTKLPGPSCRESSRRGSMAVLFSAVAMALAAMVLVATSRTNRPPLGPGSGLIIVESGGISDAPAPGPSMWSYRIASVHSVDQLDSLLAEHAGVILVSGPTVASQPLLSSRFSEEP